FIAHFVYCLCLASSPSALSQILPFFLSAGTGGPGVSLPLDFAPANRYRRDPGGSADCAVYRAGRGSDAAAATLELGEVSVQDVALSVARGVEQDRLVLAFLADRPGAKVGAPADRTRGCGVSDLDLGEKTMALRKGGDWRLAIAMKREASEGNASQPQTSRRNRQ